MPEYKAERDPKCCPPHPGALISDLLKQLGVSVSSAARDLGVSLPRLSAVIAEKEPITAEMALRLGKNFGNGAEPWLHMQTAYDLWHAAREVELSKAIPIKEHIVWDDFFAEPGVDLGERDQPPMPPDRDCLE